MGNTRTVGFDIDDQLHERLRRLAFETRQSKSAIFRAALQEHLDKIESEEF